MEIAYVGRENLEARAKQVVAHVENAHDLGEHIPVQLSISPIEGGWRIGADFLYDPYASELARVISQRPCIPLDLDLLTQTKLVSLESGLHGSSL